MSVSRTKLGTSEHKGWAPDRLQCLVLRVPYVRRWLPSNPALAAAGRPGLGPRQPQSPQPRMGLCHQLQLGLLGGGGGDGEGGSRRRNATTAAGSKSAEETRRRLPVSQEPGMRRPEWPRARAPHTPTRLAPFTPQRTRLLLEQKRQQVPGLCKPIKDPVNSRRAGEAATGQGRPTPPGRRSTGRPEMQTRVPPPASLRPGPGPASSGGRFSSLSCSSFFLK